MTTVQKIIKYLAIAFAIFIIINIASAIFWGFYSFGFIFGLNQQNEVEDRQIETTKFEYQDIEILDIDIAFSSLIIKSAQEFRVESDNNYINCKQSNKTIHIEEKNYNWFSKNNGGELIIYIPDNLELEKVKINAGAGKIDIEKITSKRLSLEIGAGGTEIKELNILDKADINGGAGKVSVLSGKINNLDLDMGVGKVELNAELTGDIDIEAGIGELDININAPKEKYKIKAEKGIGNITIDGESASDDVVYGDGENYIKIDGGIGNIMVDFE